jgi:beta-mannosidase
MKQILPLAVWSFREPRTRKWHEARVPGCVHADLHRHGLIGNPFWATNEAELQWIEEEDWLYRGAFTVGREFLGNPHIDLVAEGLDTVAEIRINSHPVGTTENMFRAYRFAVGRHLQAGRNVLEIKFASPMPYIRSRQRRGDYQEPNDPVGGCSHLRKMQASFGWDWGPRLVTSGIWQPIQLEGWAVNRLQSVRVSQDHRDGKVHLTFAVLLARAGRAKIEGVIRLRGVEVAQVVEGRATIHHPELWWPNGHGAQPLYEVELRIANSRGYVFDRWSKRIGLRTIKLDRRPDRTGETFQFSVNGRPIFAKGANWIPVNILVTEAGECEYEKLIQSAVQAHMNMIRVWGGGIYETDRFYDLCDEKGLLVWQDFMFACALYPGDRKFVNEVVREAKHQVTRLAHHACLALWCGNNEIEMRPRDLRKTVRRRRAYEEIFFRRLPAVVKEHDGATDYWPSSPHNPQGLDFPFNNPERGDFHFWDVWHSRKPVKSYELTKPRFCSEFGMQSYSSPEVAETFCNPKDWNIFGAEMDSHQKNAAGNLIVMEYISRRYRFPKDYASLAYLSQLNQAYCMKVAVEHYRRSMPHTMGALYWQLNDCWPGFSWSSIEFGGQWKALHFAARRFFAPILISAHLCGDETSGPHNRLANDIFEADLFTVSDDWSTQPAVLQWFLYHLDGRILDSGEKELTLRYGEVRNQKKLRLQKAIATHGRDRIYLRIVLIPQNGPVSEDTVLLTAPRLMNLPRSPVERTLRMISRQSYRLRLRSSEYQHQVRLSSSLDMSFSDNFFDLYPGIEREVTLHLISPASSRTILEKLQILTLTQTT